MSAAARAAARESIEAGAVESIGIIPDIIRTVAEYVGRLLLALLVMWFTAALFMFIRENNDEEDN